jgi:hypothetical protein
MTQVLRDVDRTRNAAHGTPFVVLLTRVAHGLVTAAFLTSIAAIYVAAWRREAGALTLVAIAALCVEGVLVVMSGGNCPLGPVLRKLGDEKPFFELLLPHRVAILAVPALGAVTAVGIVFLAVRTLGS